MIHRWILDEPLDFAYQPMFFRKKIALAKAAAFFGRQGSCNRPL